jgi:hypothetical protein
VAAHRDAPTDMGLDVEVDAEPLAELLGID